MSTTTTSLDRITQLKAEIAKLEEGALQELMERRNALSRELASVDAEIAKLTGKPAEKKARQSPASKGEGKKPDLQELKSTLARAEGKTLNIRGEGYDTKNIRTLAKANPSLLQMGGKGAWPTVTLTK